MYKHYFFLSIWTLTDSLNMHQLPWLFQTKSTSTLNILYKFNLIKLAFPVPPSGVGCHYKLRDKGTCETDTFLHNCRVYKATEKVGLATHFVESILQQHNIENGRAQQVYLFYLNTWGFHLNNCRWPLRRWDLCLFARQLSSLRCMKSLTCDLMHATLCMVMCVTGHMYAETWECDKWPSWGHGADI